MIFIFDLDESLLLTASRGSLSINNGADHTQGLGGLAATMSLGTLEVADVRIHKLSGVARYTYDEDDNRIPLGETKSHLSKEKLDEEIINIDSLWVQCKFNNVVDNNKAITHKTKKFNYICSINPGKLSQINGTITNLADPPVTSFQSSGRFIAEFMIVARD